MNLGGVCVFGGGGGGVYNYSICQVTKNGFISGSNVYYDQASVFFLPSWLVSVSTSLMSAVLS